MKRGSIFTLQMYTKGLGHNTFPFGIHCQIRQSTGLRVNGSAWIGLLLS